MKLKVIGVLAGSLMCSTAFAAKSDFTGYYAGVRAGGMVTQAKVENNTSATFVNQYDSDNQLSVNGSNNVWNNSLAGDLFFGYGKFVNNSRFYLGGEGFVELANPEGTLAMSSYHQQPNDDDDRQTLSTNTTASLDHIGFGVDFRPGYLLDSRTLVYGRVGLAFNRETIDAKNTFTFYNIPDDITTNNTLNTSKTRDTIGIRLGFGAERRINSKLAVTVDYVYTDYGRVKVFGMGDVTTDYPGDMLITSTVTNGFVNSSNGSLVTQTLMFGLKYNIA
ncbi:MAG: outer membrane beta-barrel protein [Gammaproteobacteria bacterium]|nr:outer membrane beta-barrel protein [Gammaproteobacteria bacterium]